MNRKRGDPHSQCKSCELKAAAEWREERRLEKQKRAARDVKPDFDESLVGNEVDDFLASRLRRGRRAGLSEGAVWKMLRGKVPGRSPGGSKSPKSPIRPGRSVDQGGEKGHRVVYWVTQAGFPPPWSSEPVWQGQFIFGQGRTNVLPKQTEPPLRSRLAWRRLRRLFWLVSASSWWSSWRW